MLNIDAIHLCTSQSVWMIHFPTQIHPIFSSPPLVFQPLIASYPVRIEGEGEGGGREGEGWRWCGTSYSDTKQVIRTNWQLCLVSYEYLEIMRGGNLSCCVAVKWLSDPLALQRKTALYSGYFIHGLIIESELISCNTKINSNDPRYFN